jgi:hypothetical protein
MALEFLPGDRVRLTAAHAGASTDVTWQWTPPVGSSAPASSTDTLEWDAITPDDEGTYEAEATSPTALDSPVSGVIDLELGRDPDATIYINNVETADGQPLEEAVKKAMNRLVIDLKAATGYSAMSNFIPGIGGRTIEGGMVPLIGSAPTLQNLTQSDYSRTMGVRGDGVTKCGFMLPGGTVGDVHISVYVSENLTVSGRHTFLGMDQSGVSLEVSLFSNNQTLFYPLAEFDGSLAPLDWSVVPGFVGTADDGALPERWTNIVETSDFSARQGVYAPTRLGFLARCENDNSPFYFLNGSIFGMSTGVYYDEPMKVRAALIRYQTSLIAALP